MELSPCTPTLNKSMLTFYPDQLVKEFISQFLVAVSGTLDGTKRWQLHRPEELSALQYFQGDLPVLWSGE